MRIAQFLLPLVLLLATVAAQPGPGGWSQLRGGPDHPGRVDLAPTPLDVVGSHPLLDSGSLGVHTGLLRIGQGWVTDYYDDGARTCGLLFVDNLAEGSIRRSGPQGCPHGGIPELFAYDSQGNFLLSCQAGTSNEPVLLARDGTTAKPVWAVTPEDFGVLATGDGPGSRLLWHCTAGAMDPTTREAVVGIHGPGTGRGWVASVNLDDGKVIWARSTPATAVAGQGSLPPAANDPRLNPATDAGFEADEVTITQTRIAVGGDIGDRVQAVVWLDREGHLLGGTSAQPGQTGQAVEPATARSRSGAWVGNGGELATIVLDNRLLVIKPGEPQLEEHVIEALEPVNDPYLYPWPAWWDTFLLVPLKHSVHAFHAPDVKEIWSWYLGPSWRVSDVVVAPPFDAYILATHNRTEGEEAILLRMDLITGVPLQRLSLPLQPQVRQIVIEDVEVTRWFAELIPSPEGGLFVLDRQGQMAILGPAAGNLVPEVVVSSLYPRPREEVVIRPIPVAGKSPARYVIGWGSGPIQEIGPGGEARSEYATTGPRTLRVTAVYHDGRTATAERVIDVGGTPPTRPAELNILQRAFARENLDLTFGILGIAIAFGGGVVALGRNRTRRRRVGRELDNIQQSLSAGGDDPVRVEAALADHRARVRHEGLRGRLEHGDVVLLERRLDEAARQVRLDALEARFGFLTVGMARALRGMLTDARISAWERQHVLDALEQDKDLTAEQKRRVRRQIDAWFAEDQRKAAPS